MKILYFLLCKRKTQYRWHEKYVTQSLPKELLLHLLLLLPAFWLTKECVWHVWFTRNKSLNSCGCRETLKLCKYQVWFPSHIRENKLNSIWKVSLLQFLKKEHHVTMIHCYRLILSECWRAHEQNPIISVPEHCKGEGQAMLLRPTHNAPGPTKGIPVHEPTAFPHSELGPSVSPSYFIISAITKFSEPKKPFFFSYSLWYNMRFPCLFYVPGDKWWGKHFWSSFICQWQMQRFIWNTSKMEKLTLSLQFRWKVLPRWRVSLL